MKHGELRAIIDTFSYSSYVVPAVAKNIINKCKSLQNIYENAKLRDYKIYSPKGKTTNHEVIKNIEDITVAIYEKNKIQFDYWKYDIVKNNVEKIITSSPMFSPFAIIYDKQQFYLVGIKEGYTELSTYRLDRIKNLKITDFKIELNVTDEELQEFTDSQVEVFGGNSVEIVAECNKILLGEVYERFGTNAEIEVIDNDNFRLKVKCNQFGFKMFAMRNMDLVTVKAPETLVTEIKNIIKEANNRYK